MFLPDAPAMLFAFGERTSRRNLAFAADEVSLTVRRPSSGVEITNARDLADADTEPARVRVVFFVHGAVTSCSSSVSALSSGYSALVTMSHGAS